MARRFDTSDPRSIVTAEAFNLAPELLGKPLAPPRRRLAALLVDLALIGLLSRAGGLLLGIAATLFIFRIAAGGPVNEALKKAFRVAVGCFGAVVLLVTGCSLYFAFGPDGDEGSPIAAVQRALEEEGRAELPEELGLEDVFSGMSEVRTLRDAGSREEAVSAAVSLARRLERAGAPRSDIRDFLEELTRDAPFEGEEDAVARAALAALDTPRVAAGSAVAAPDTRPEEEPGLLPSTEPARPPVGELSLDAVLSEYADSLRGGSAAPDTDRAARRGELRRRIVGELGADTLEALAEELDDETRDREAAERRLEGARQQLREARDEPGVLSWIRDVIDDLGLAFGWGGIYMTIFLAWWNGQTPGKRLLGIRVVQLDDSPMTWWEAFERSGGYAAGFATGLLGFAQVYWDPNRQAIHDKISETVVVLDRAERVPGPWTAGAADDDGETRIGSPV